MSEIRKDPVTNQWVIIAPERGAGPREFEPDPPDDIGPGSCPMCEGNERMTPPETYAVRDGSEPNSRGWHVRIVPNKFPALRAEGEPGLTQSGLYQSVSGVGAHEIVIESPVHTEDLAFAPDEQTMRVLSAVKHRAVALAEDPRFRQILVFRNHRRAAGATLSHPHSQIIALPVIPSTAHTRLVGSHAYHQQSGRCIFCDLVGQEADAGERVVLKTDHFIALAPYASAYSYTTVLYPLAHCHDFTQMSIEAQADLARALRRLLLAYRTATFNSPYNLVYQTAPKAPEDPTGHAYCWNLADHFHWHIEIIPRLSTVVGFERDTGMYLNPVAPETAARELRGAIT